MVGLAVVAATLGCTPAIEYVTETSVEPAVHTGLEEMTDEENKQRLEELMQLEGLEGTGERFGRGMTRGVLTAGVDLEHQLEQMELQDQLEAGFALIAEHLEHQLGPVLEQIAASTTRAVIQQLGRPQTRRHAELFAAAITDAVMDAIADGIRDQLGPAVHQMFVEQVGPGLEHIIEHNVGPGIQRMLDDEFNEAVGETARVVSRQAAIGATEGLVEMEVIDPEEPALLELAAERVAQTIRALGWVFWVLVAVFVALFVVFAGWAARLILQARDIKKRSDLREDTIVRLAEAIKRVERNGPQSRELLREVSHQVDEIDEEE